MSTLHTKPAPSTAIPTVTPEALDRAADSLPAAWRTLPIYLGFRLYAKPNGRIGKEPLVSGTDRHASSTNGMTWRPLGEALADCRRRDLWLGLALPPGHTLIDEDGVISPDGAIAQATLDRIRQLGSLTVKTVSEIGTHTYVAGLPPENASHPPEVEVYPGKRLVLFTGNVIDGFDTLRDVSDVLAELFPAAKPAATSLPALDLTDEIVIARTLRMEKGRRLHEGDTSDYASASEADLALLGYYIIAGATSFAQLNRLYQNSKLHRDKWKRKDYRERTIAKALSGAVVPFEDWNKPKVLARSGRVVRTIPRVRGRRPVIELSRAGAGHAL